MIYDGIQFHLFCRIQTYNEYNRELDDLLATAKLDSYPVLCSSMTEAFNKLSESVIRIKVRKYSPSLSTLLSID